MIDKTEAVTARYDSVSGNLIPWERAIACHTRRAPWWRQIAWTLAEWFARVGHWHGHGGHGGACA